TYLTLGFVQLRLLDALLHELVERAGLALHHPARTDTVTVAVRHRKTGNALYGIEAHAAARTRGSGGCHAQRAVELYSCGSCFHSRLSHCTLLFIHQGA